ncbi:RICIN domain-containing protein [Streptomyces uncialis]|uniref:RICIN domain-containing protein n=1 Tax=Streptomyces uncialis TaxID=1048205 RepID=UPI00382C49C0
MATLNILARFGQGAELTRLEQATVASFRRAGISDERIAEYGRIFAEASPKARAKAFPDSAADLTSDTAYGGEDLLRDAKQVARDVSNLPQTRLVELTPGRTNVELPLHDAEAAAAVSAAGWSVTVLHTPLPEEPAAALAAAPDVTRAAAPAVTPPAAPLAVPAAVPVGQGRTFVSADNFYCDVESTEASADDELYFLFGAFDRSGSVTQWLSPTIENVDAGETHSFSSNTLWSGPVAPGGLAVTVDVWEEDSGDHRDQSAAFKLTVAQSLVDSLLPQSAGDHILSGIEMYLDASEGSVSSPFVQIITFGISAFADAVIGWAHDDHVGTHVFIFSDTTLQGMAATRDPGTYEMVIDGTANGEPRIRLRLSGTGMPPERPVRLLNRLSGKALTVDSAQRQTDGGNIIQEDYQSPANSGWSLIVLEDGNYALSQNGSGRVLSVDSGSTADGANVVQWPYQGGANQKWIMLPTSFEVGRISYALLSTHSGKALTVHGASLDNGGNVDQWTFSGQQNQQWYIEDI